MDRFDKFTERARNVLTLAQDEAQRFNHNYIGTEHLLLGLVREGEGVASRVLENMNVELTKVRTAVEFIIGRGDRPPVGEVGLTPRAKRVIELAIDESSRLGHTWIGTEHLLLGVVREGEGIAAGVLESLGVNLDKVRHEVIRVLAESGVTSVPRSEDIDLSPPPRRYQRFSDWTDHARQTLLTARGVADRRGNSVLTPEHLLLGAVDAPDGSATVALTLLGVRVEALRSAVESRLDGRSEDPAATAGLSEQALAVLDVSEIQARALNDVEVDSVHMVLALLGQDELGQLLGEFGVTPGALRIALGKGQR
jgi:ATP-dependent Clp protease ATP-binding subunit ClpA